MEIMACRLVGAKPLSEPVLEYCSSLLGYPRPAGWIAVDNAWIAIEHRPKSPGFYLPIYTGNVLLKLGFDVQSQTEVRVRKLKNQIWPQAAILKMALLKINRLFPYTQVTCYWRLDLIFKAKLRLEPRKLKNPIWLPGDHFERDISESQ